MQDHCTILISSGSPQISFIAKTGPRCFQIYWSFMSNFSITEIRVYVTNAGLFVFFSYLIMEPNRWTDEWRMKVDFQREI